MVDYRLFINNGVDAFNTTGKTLAMIIVSAVTDRTIQMLCEMCNEDYRETLEYFCDTLVQNADFNKLRDELKKGMKQ